MARCCGSSACSPRARGRARAAITMSLRGNSSLYFRAKMQDSKIQDFDEEVSRSRARARARVCTRSLSPRARVLTRGAASLHAGRPPAPAARGLRRVRCDETRADPPGATGVSRGEQEHPGPREAGPAAGESPARRKVSARFRAARGRRARAKSEQRRSGRRPDLTTPRGDRPAAAARADTRGRSEPQPRDVGPQPVEQSVHARVAGLLEQVGVRLLLLAELLGEALQLGLVELVARGERGGHAALVPR